VQTERQLADSQLEARLRTWAIPAALASAFLLVYATSRSAASAWLSSRWHIFGDSLASAARI